jgi:hypothetical protein
MALRRCVSREGYQPFPAGTRIIEPRYIDPIIAGVVEAGLGVEVRR